VITLGIYNISIFECLSLETIKWHHPWWGWHHSWVGWHSEGWDDPW